jgi:hypothetical protein
MDKRGIEPRTSPMLRECYTTKPFARYIFTPHNLKLRLAYAGCVPKKHFIDLHWHRHSPILIPLYCLHIQLRGALSTKCLYSTPD